MDTNQEFLAVATKLILLFFSKAQQSYYSKPPREQLRVSPHGKPELAGLKRNLKIAFDEIELESVAKLSKLTMPCQEVADEAILTDGSGGEVGAMAEDAVKNVRGQTDRH